MTSVAKLFLKFFTSLILRFCFLVECVFDPVDLLTCLIWLKVVVFLLKTLLFDGAKFALANMR